MWTDLLPTLLLLLSIAVQAQLSQLPQFPSTDSGNAGGSGSPGGAGGFIFKPTTIGLLEYNKDGCPADQTFTDQISNSTSCNPITGIDINNVIVIPKPDMLPTCILTLYADPSCLGDSNARIGPIFPAAIPSDCIGPIRNPVGDLFLAKGATLHC